MPATEAGLPTAHSVLAAAGLAMNYGRTAALHEASLEVDRGESVAVMGPSGSGKSTLLYCLAGVLKPDRGEVVFDGVRVDELSDARRTELRRSVFGFVFQFPGLLPELSADENVALPRWCPWARLEGEGEVAPEREAARATTPTCHRASSRSYAMKSI